MLKLIDPKKVVFNYGGLMYIDSNDFIGISKYFYDQIQAQPTIDAEPVTYGYWEALSNNKYCDCFKCSNCGRIIRTYDLSEYPYCNCGAKMKRKWE